MSEKGVPLGAAISAANLLLMRAGSIGQKKGYRGFGRLELQHLLSLIYGVKIPLSALQAESPEVHTPKHDCLEVYLDERPKMTSDKSADILN